jgi:hypothetical protein
LEIIPLEEQIFIKPYETPLAKADKEQLISIPISISTEDWLKWKKGDLK